MGSAPRIKYSIGTYLKFVRFLLDFRHEIHSRTKIVDHCTHGSNHQCVHLVASLDLEYLLSSFMWHFNYFIIIMDNKLQYGSQSPRQSQQKHQLLFQYFCKKLETINNIP